MSSASSKLLPADFLEEWGRSKNRQLFLLTGVSGAGKTTWCLQLAQEAAARGWKVGGLCSPALFEGGRKTGIELVDLHTFARRRLAVRKPQPVAGEPSLEWKFDEEVLAWGNSLLLRGDNELLILDELGPLEFDHGIGFQNAFAVLDEAHYNLACVVVRPSLLLRAQDRWPAARLLDIGEARS
jgi:nucleoside-triphosphatase